MPSAWISCLQSRMTSSVSRMVKSERRFASSAWRRSSLTPIEWKVPSQGMPSTAPPTRTPMRSFISRAALLVKVTDEDLRGIGEAEIENMGDAGGQNPGLAGAGAGQNQHRALDAFDRIGLLGIEAREIVRRRPCGVAGGHGARGNSATRGAGCGGAGCGIFVAEKRNIVIWSVHTP
jgi:hypothetical protein